MMNHLDEMLARLAAQRAPDALAAMDGEILGGVGPRRERQAVRRTLALAGGVALAVGASGPLFPARPPHVEPLLGTPEAAPSHLLVD